MADEFVGCGQIGSEASRGIGVYVQLGRADKMGMEMRLLS